MDDIVTRLRNHAEDEAMLGNDWLRDIMRDGADEIERLRELAYLLIDELRFNGGYEAYTPKMLFDEFYEQAVRGE